jgi:hypothetical protein
MSDRHAPLVLARIWRGQLVVMIGCLEGDLMPCDEQRIRRPPARRADRDEPLLTLSDGSIGHVTGTELSYRSGAVARGADRFRLAWILPTAGPREATRTATPYATHAGCDASSGWRILAVGSHVCPIRATPARRWW